MLLLQHDLVLIPSVLLFALALLCFAFSFFYTNTTTTDISPPASPSASSASSSDRRLSHAARHMVDSQALDISQVQGSAKGGLVTKGDVILGVKAGVAVKGSSSARQRSPPPALASIASTTPVAAPTSQQQQQKQVSGSVSVSSEIGGTFTDIKNSNMRKVIAKRLTESKTTVPHQYTAIDCEIDELLALRKTLKNDFGVNVSVNDVVIKAAALALRDVPECNGKWVPKTGKYTCLRLYNRRLFRGEIICMDNLRDSYLQAHPLFCLCIVVACTHVF